MAETQGINVSPIIPSQNELAQTHISTDRKSFMLMVEAKLKQLVTDFGDTKTTSIMIDDVPYADKFSAGATLALNRYVSDLETAQTTFNSVYQSLVKFEKSVQSLLG